MKALRAAVPRPGGTGRERRSHRVHLYFPGYTPGAKQRWTTETAMCGTTKVGLYVGPAHDRRPSGWQHLTMTTAAEHIAARPELGWCPMCLGRAAQELGLLNGLAVSVDIAAGVWPSTAVSNPVHDGVPGASLVPPAHP